MNARKRPKSLKKINGIEFAEMKAIYNSIIDDDPQKLEVALTNFQNINYRIESYDAGHPVDWSSSVSMQQSRTFKPILHMSVELGRAKCTACLIQRGADVNLYSTLDKEENNLLHTSLHAICMGETDEQSDYPGTARALLENGARLDYRISNNSDEPNAYEFCLNIQKEKNTSDELDLNKFITPRFHATQTANLVKPIFKVFFDLTQKNQSAEQKENITVTDKKQVLFQRKEKKPVPIEEKTLKQAKANRHG